MIAVRYLAIVTLLFTAIFELLRGLLLFRYNHLIMDIPSSALIKAFIVGLRFDLAVTCYIIAPAALIGLLPRIGLAASQLTRKLTVIYFTVMGGLAFFMTLADLEFLGAFNTRLNHLTFTWMETPSVVLRMIWEMSSTIPILIGFTVLMVFFWFVLSRLNRRIFRDLKPEPLSRLLVVYPIVFFHLFLGIRGNIKPNETPINWKTAYFSQHYFANQIALNSCFTFVKDMIDTEKRKKDEKLSVLIPYEEAIAEVQSLLMIDSTRLLPGYPLARLESLPPYSSPEQEVRENPHSSEIEEAGREALQADVKSNPHSYNTEQTKPSDNPGHLHINEPANSGNPYRPLNVIIIVMESMASEFIGSCGGSKNLTPEFDRIAEQGLLFKRFYSGGGLTRLSLFTIITGLPCLPETRSFVNKPVSHQSFSGLNAILKPRGYKGLFFTVANTEIGNKRVFFHSNGFGKVIGEADYPEDEILSCYGVPDDVMYNRALTDLNEVKEPFFAVLLTCSNHPPFIIPNGPFPRVNQSDPNAERFNAFLYADWALGQFFERAIATDWGKNSLFLITGDSGINWYPKLELDPSLFHVPLLLFCPGIIEPGVSERIGGQKDIIATVMNVLGGEWVNNTLSRSLLIDSGNNCALVVQGESFGFITDDYYLIYGRNRDIRLYDTDTLKSLPETADIKGSLLKSAASLLSTTYHLVMTRQVKLPELSAVNHTQ